MTPVKRLGPVPTDAMCIAAREKTGIGANVADHVYRAMYAAAPDDTPIDDLIGQDIDAAEAQAAIYEGDDRECITTDVMNAFYAGIAYERQRLAGQASPVTLDAGSKHRISDAEPGNQN